MTTELAQPDVRAVRPAALIPARRLAYAGLALGIALLTALLAHQGIGDVARALAAGGAGLLVVALFHVIPMFADAMGWRRLLAPAERPRVSTMVFARWVGESVNSLLPVLQIGGNVAKARVIVRRGVPGTLAAATVVVDVTLVMFTQLAFTAVGIVLLLTRLGGRRMVPAATAGLVLTALGLAGFYVAQRLGLFTLGACALASVRGAGGVAIAA